MNRLIIRRLALVVTLCSGLALFSGCGGGGGGGGNSSANQSAPTIVASNVPDGATNVDPAVRIEVTLSAAVDPASMTADWVTLEAVGPAAGAIAQASEGIASPTARFTTIASEILVTGTTITLVPGSKLAFNTTYRVSFRVRAPSAGDFITLKNDFTTADGAWTEASVLDTFDVTSLSGYGRSRSLAVAPSGQSVAVWLRPAGAERRVMSSRTVGPVPWLDPIELGDAGTSIKEPSVAMDDDGNAWVVWIKESLLGGTGPGQMREVWGARRPAGSSTWTAPTLLSGPFQEASTVTIRAGRSGAVVLWSEAGPSVALLSVRAGVSSWSDPVEVVALGSLAGISSFRLDRLPAGTMRASWLGMPWGMSMVDESTSSDQTESGTWTTPVASDWCVSDCANRALALYPAGDVVDLSAQQTTSGAVRRAIHASTLLSRAFQTGLEVIDGVADGSSEAPRVVADNSGNAFAIWTQATGGEPRIWGSRHRVLAGWDRATQHAGAQIGRGIQADIGIDRDNIVHATRVSAVDNGNGTYTVSIHASRFWNVP